MIFFECDSDERLVRVLVESQQTVLRHASGKGRVYNLLKKNENCIALVDQDPSSASPTYHEKTHQLRSDHDLMKVQIELCGDDRGNHLIILCPRLEDWVLRVARKEGVDPGDFNLPSTARELHKIRGKRLDDFEKFIRSLIAQGSEDLKALQSLLTAQ